MTAAGRDHAVPEAPLNEAQSRAAGIVEGPVLVIAGAGTGKTHTLIHRLVRLVSAGIPPESILLLTFTRRAAEEMIERASAILGGGRAGVAGGTFHSFAHRTLRRYGGAIGLATDFTILDQSDTFEILGGIRSELREAEPHLRLPRRETVAAILSKAVNKQVPIEDVAAEEYPQFFEVADYLGVAASRYESYKRERNLVDFDNLLVLLVRLLQESAETRERVHERYRFVMVDEYQDTNLLQAHITHLLAGERANVMVVGDDAQSIYAFRGANPRNLFEFRESFPDARVVTLEENYRSTQSVLDVANALMAQMSEAFRKHLFTRRGGGRLPLLVEAEDEQEQAVLVASEIQKLLDDGVTASEIGVLFRAGRHAFALELELQSRGVAYVKYGGFRFMESAHIKDVLAHVRLVAYPDDDLSLRRVLTMREGLGRTTARRVVEAASGGPLVEALRGFSARGKVRRSLDELAELLSELEARREEPARCLEAAVEGYNPLLEVRFDDWPRRRRDLETLVDLCERYRSLSSMLSDLALDPPSTASEEGLVGGGERERERVVLSTMHSAKGLEWRAVFVIQARDGYIPMTLGRDEELEDETFDEDLRLFYVAVTRAKDFLTIVWPRETARSQYTWALPSRFLAPFADDLLERYEAADLLA